MILAEVDNVTRCHAGAVFGCRRGVGAGIEPVSVCPGTAASLELVLDFLEWHLVKAPVNRAGIAGNSRR